MPVDYNALGSRIAHYRGKLNLSQEELAEQVNLSREYINKIETAARKPTLDTLIDRKPGQRRSHAAARC